MTDLTKYSSFLDTLGKPSTGAQDPTQPELPTADYQKFLDTVGKPTDPQKAVRAGLDQNPDEAAKIDDLSKKSGVPSDMVKIDPAAVEKDLKAQLISDITIDSPVTQTFLTDPVNAAVAQDSVPQLADIERYAGITVASPEQQNISWEQGLQGLAVTGKRAWQGTTAIGSGVVDFFRNIKAIDLAIQENARATNQWIYDLFGKGDKYATSPDAVRKDKLISDAMKDQTDLEAVANSLFNTEGVGKEGQMVLGGLRSFGANIPGAAVSAVTLNPGPSLALAGLSTGGASYMDARKAGLTPLEAAGYGALQGSIEVGTEFIPGVDFIKKIKAGSPFVDMLTSQLVKENIGEQVATAAQDAVEWLTLHPEKSMQDYLDERPDAALQTFVATMVATSAQTAVTKLATIPFQKDLAESQIALENRQAIEGVRQAMLAAPMAQRDMPRLAEHAADSLKASGVQNVYISAPALEAAAQASGNPDVFYQDLGIENQVQEALLLGIDVKMPTSAFTAKIMATPLYDQVADHIRLGQDQMTAAEAQDFQANGLNDELERLGLEAALAGAGAARIDPIEAAADGAIDMAENELGLQALFHDAAQAGFTPQQFTSYLLAVAEAKDNSRKRQEAKIIRQQLRESDAEWKKQRELVREAVREEVSNVPMYALMNAIGGGGQRIDRQSILDLMPDRMVYDQATGINSIETSEDQLKKLGLPKLNGRDIFTNKTEKTGISADILAQQHGFGDATEMLLALVEAPAQQAVIERETDKRMMDTYGDLRRQMDGLREAIDSMHNDGQALILAIELNALAQAKTDRKLSAAKVRAAARQRLLDYDVKDVTEEKFLAAERREGRLAAKLLRKGDRQGAAQAKFRQLMNFQMAREAIDIRAKRQKEAKYLNKWTKTKKRPNIDHKFVSAIQQILSDYKIGNRISLAKRLEMEKLMYALGVEAGGDVPVHPRLVQEDATKNYQDMSVREWNELVANIKMLEHQGKRVKTMVVKGREIDKENRKEKMLEKSSNLPELSEAKELRERETAGFLERKRMWLRGLHTSFSKVEFALQKLDNGELGGVWHDTIFQPAVKAQSNQADDIRKYMKPLVEALRDIPNSTKKKLGKSASLGNKKGTRAELLAMALNVGNESNLSKLIEGSKLDNRGVPPLTQEKVDTALAQLTPEELQWVQKVWDVFEQIYPKVADVYAEEFGSPPTKIEHREFTVNGVKMRGGYYPVMFNKQRQNNPRVNTTKDLLKAQELRASVYAGMTKERTGYAAPLSLDLEGLPRAMEQVIHYYTHYAPVRDIRKMLTDKDVSSEIKAKLGMAQFDEMLNWVEAIANPASQRDSKDNSLNSIGQWVRGNLISSVLGGSVTTLASQTLGRFTSVAVLGREEGGKFSALRGERWLASGYLTAMTSPQAVGQAFAASNELRTRAESTDRDISYMMKKLQGRASPWSQFKRWTLLSIGYFQLYTVDLPTWIAGYNKALAEGKSEEKAVNYADAVLRTSQGSGHVKDQSRIQRSTNAFVQSFTMFSTYTMLAYNLEAQTLSDAKKVRNLPGSILRLGYLVVMPALLDALMRGQGPDEDDDEDAVTWGAKTALKYAASTLPIGGSLLRGGGVPAENLVQSLIGTVDDVTKIADNDYEMSPAQQRRLISAFGLLTGAPTVQINRVLKAMEEDDATIQDYLVGPKKE